MSVNNSLARALDDTQESRVREWYESLQEGYETRLTGILDKLKGVYTSVHDDPIIAQLKQDPASAEHVQLRVRELISDTLESEREAFIRKTLLESADKDAKIAQFSRDMEGLKRSLTTTVAEYKNKVAALESEKSSLLYREEELRRTLESDSDSLARELKRFEAEMERVERDRDALRLENEKLRSSSHHMQTATDQLALKHSQEVSKLNDKHQDLYEEKLRTERTVDSLRAEMQNTLTNLRMDHQREIESTKLRHRGELEDKDAVIRERDAQLADLKNALRRKDLDVEQVGAQHSEELRRSLAVINEEKAEIQRLKDENEHMKTANRELKGLNTQLLEDLREAEGELQQAERQYNMLKDKYKAVGEKVESLLQLEASEAQDVVADLEKRLRGVKQDLADSLRERKELERKHRGENDRQDEELRRLQREIDKRDSALESMHGKLTTYKGHLEDLEKEKSLMQSRIRGLESDLEMKDTSMSNQEQSMNRMREEIRFMQQEKQSALLERDEEIKTRAQRFDHELRNMEARVAEIQQEKKHWQSEYDRQHQQYLELVDRNTKDAESHMRDATRIEARIRDAAAAQVRELEKEYMRRDEHAAILNRHIQDLEERCIAESKAIIENYELEMKERLLGLEERKQIDYDQSMSYLREAMGKLEQEYKEEQERRERLEQFLKESVEKAEEGESARHTLTERLQESNNNISRLKTIVEQETQKRQEAERRVEMLRQLEVQLHDETENYQTLASRLSEKNVLVHELEQEIDRLKSNMAGEISQAAHQRAEEQNEWRTKEREYLDEITELKSANEDMMNLRHADLTRIEQLEAAALAWDDTREDFINRLAGSRDEYEESYQHWHQMEAVLKKEIEDYRTTIHTQEASLAKQKIITQKVATRARTSVRTLQENVKTYKSAVEAQLGFMQQELVRFVDEVKWECKKRLETQSQEKSSALARLRDELSDSKYAMQREMDSHHASELENTKERMREEFAEKEKLVVAECDARVAAAEKRNEDLAALMSDKGAALKSELEQVHSQRSALEEMGLQLGQRVDSLQEELSRAHDDKNTLKSHFLAMVAILNRTLDFGGRIEIDPSQPAQVTEFFSILEGTAKEASQGTKVARRFEEQGEEQARQHEEEISKLKKEAAMLANLAREEAVGPYRTEVNTLKVEVDELHHMYKNETEKRDGQYNGVLKEKEDQIKKLQDQVEKMYSKEHKYEANQKKLQEALVETKKQSTSGEGRVKTLERELEEKKKSFEAKLAKKDKEMQEMAKLLERSFNSVSSSQIKEASKLESETKKLRRRVSGTD